MEESEEVTTISKTTEARLPIIVMATGIVAISSVAFFAARTWSALEHKIDTVGSNVEVRMESLGKTINSMQGDLGKIADRVDTGPTRREFELAMERIRLLEAKSKE